MEKMTLPQFIDYSLPILLGFIAFYFNKALVILKSRQFKLETHQILPDIKIYINRMNSWNIDNNRKVFVDAFIIKFNIWYIELKNYIPKLKKIHNRKELMNSLIEWSLNTIELYTKEWKEKGIPDKVINHITRIHQGKVDKFLSEIKTVCNDKTFPTIHLVKREILTVLRILLSETLDDVNDIVYRSKYNGEFKDVVYKGIPVNDDEYTNYSKNKNK